jgi:hypothetical protein
VFLLLLRRVSASVLGHLQGAYKFTNACSFYVNVMGGRSTYVMKILPSKLTYKLHTRNTYALPEDGQELKPKHVGAIINKQMVQQVAIKYCIYVIYS